MSSITAIVGDRGSGKTALETRYLKLAADSGRKVVCNYSLYGIKHELMTFQEIREVISNRNTIKQIEGCMMALDEGGVGMDSYRFFDADTKAITDFAVQIRKIGVDIIYTVQRIMLIAARFRRQTDLFIAMRDLDKGNMRKPDGSRVKNHKEVCQGKFETGAINDIGEWVSRPRVFNGKSYFQYYNTDEMIWA